MNGTNNPAQDVTWSMEGGIAGTSIDANGKLTVTAGETASSLTVKATSTVDTGKFGTATVMVTTTPLPVVAPAVDPPDAPPDRTVTVVVGNTATMSITATGATRYQWYKSVNGGTFLPIGGATGTSYTTSPVTMVNNGYRYCCVATNSAGSTRGCPFVLNVIE